MNASQSLSDYLFSINSSNFEARAIELFRNQAQNNPVYNQYISLHGIDVLQVSNLHEIPFLPIEFYKTHKIKTGKWDESIIFYSSGTTGQQRSRNLIKEVGYYHTVAESIFNQFYGNLADYHIMALLPSYLEREGASLVIMVENFIRRSHSSFSGFYLNNHSELMQNLERLKNSDKKVLLIGVSFALLDLAEKYSADLSNVIVMETGGMKGRREELTRAELHTHLQTSFNIKEVHSEYGMTELMSQAYSRAGGRFETAPWMRVLIRDLNDPFSLSKRASGGINLIDLANSTTCAFIETQDLGTMHTDGTFEVTGRYDNSEARGCNLMLW